MPSPQPAPLAPGAQDLEQAFGVFNELSERLTTAYGQLETRVALLSDELACSRRERLNERVEKEHLADQLGVLLEALPAAVVLVDMRDRVDRFNPAAEQLFPELAWGRLWSSSIRCVASPFPRRLSIPNTSAASRRRRRWQSAWPWQLRRSARVCR